MRVKGAKKRVAIALAAALVVSGIGYVPKADAESVTQVTGDYSQEVNEVCDTMEFVVSDPKFGSEGGEWAALVLGRAGRMTEEWKTKYLAAVKTSFDNVSETLKAQNKLHRIKLTDNSRAIIGLYSAGADVTDFYGWNLCAPLAGDNAGGDKTEKSADYTATLKQGINGPIYALIALDYAGYKSEGETKVTDVMEENTTTLRDDYLNYILSKEISGGGWALSGTSADPDITMMAVQALSKYTYLPEVNDAVERALTVMSSKQNAQGGYSSWGSVNAESISQVICGLTMLGIDPTTDERFIKNGNTLVDALKSFSADCVKDKVTYSEYRGYAHAEQNGVMKYNQMATEQAGYAMVALWCQKKGQKLYQNGFRDIPDTTPTVTPIATPEVTETPTTAPSEPAVPTVTPVQSENPDAGETAAPSAVPTMTPSAAPTTSASAVPTKAPATPVTPAPTAVATKTPTAVATKIPVIPTPAATTKPAIPTPATTTKPENPDIVPTATPKAPEPTKTPEATKAPEPTKTPETAKKPAVTKAPETIVISKIVKKAAVEKGKKITIKAIVNGKKVKCKVSSYNKKALKVTVKNGKLVIKAKKKAKAGKTYKVVIKYKKGKKTVKKTVKITVK